MLLAHGFRLSSYMNNKSFLWWVYFLPLIFGYLLFLLIPCRIGNVEDATVKWDPHVILLVQ
jgi:hypothetical protein